MYATSEDALEVKFNFLSLSYVSFVVSFVANGIKKLANVIFN